MTQSTDLERLLASWMAADGPQDIPQHVIGAAFQEARAIRPRQRAGTDHRVIFGLLAAVLTAMLVGGALLVASRLIEPSPSIVVPPSHTVSTSQPSAAIVIPPSHMVFTPTGSMSVARMPGTFTATRLRDGRVLVVGGSMLRPPTEDAPNEQVLTSAEIWDPVTGTFTLTGSLTQARSGHTATLLDDGRVLVVGGGDASGESSPATTSAEIWDPSTDRFSPTGPLVEPRNLHTATLLEDGRVLVVGGFGEERSEVWDPDAGTFSPSGALIKPREAHTATLLGDGRVLIIGGDQGDFDALASAELWDPATGTFSPAGRLSQGRTRHAVTLLPDGRVLVVGGVDDHYAVNILGVHVLGSAEVWDPSTLTFGPAGTLLYQRADATATVLADGRVLVAGGGIVSDVWHDMDHVATAELWDPATSTFENGPTLATARSGHTATLLDDGRILLVGGETIPAVRDCFGGHTVPMDSACGTGGLQGLGVPILIASAEIYMP